MHPYPHTYRVTANGAGEGPVRLGASGRPEIASMPPPEFDGPGGYWAPEILLIAALADCFVLSFRAVARASRLEWRSLECQIEGVLDKQDGTAQFTHFRTRATLEIAPGADAARGRLLLEKAEKVCLIGNSLKAAKELDCQVLTGTSTA